MALIITHATVASDPQSPLLDANDWNANHTLTGSIAWGEITGTLSTQADLQTALNLKANLASPTFTGTVTLPAGQVVNGVTLTTAGSASDFLNAEGDYVAAGGGSPAFSAITSATNTTASMVVGTGASISVTGSGTIAATSVTGFSGTSSGTNTGDQTTITGNAGTATALQNARTINGTSFDGTANITITAAAGTLTGATLAAGVTASSLTSVGTLTSLTVSGSTALNELALDGTPNTDDTVNGPTTSTFNAGATIAQWELVYMGSGGEWLLADADTSATSGPVLLALAAASGTDNNPMKVALAGSFCRNDAWAWTVGAAIYASATAGALTETAPSTTGQIVRVAGYAVSADVIYFMPSGAWVEVP